MIWEELFSWSNQTKIKYTDNSAKVIDSNTLIQQSVFSDIKKESTISIVDKSYYCSIDYCFFVGCSSKEATGKIGCLHFTLTGYGSVSITRTIADSCSCSYAGNFANIQVADFGHIFVMMTSVDRCAPDLSPENYHSIFMISGTQIVKNINNTRCLANRHPGFSNHAPKSAQVDFCNIADNTAGMTCIYFVSLRCEVRRVNFIRNHQKSLYPQLPGVVGAYSVGSSYRIILSDCVFAGNEGYSEVGGDSVDFILIGCSLERGDFSMQNGRVYNIEPRQRDRVTMTLMEGMGKFAEIPYGEKTEKIHPKIHAVISFGFMAALSEGINKLL